MPDGVWKKGTTWRVQKCTPDAAIYDGMFFNPIPKGPCQAYTKQICQAPHRQWSQ